MDLLNQWFSVTTGGNKSTWSFIGSVLLLEEIKYLGLELELCITNGKLTDPKGIGLSI
jgi:hypothetical protein